MIVPLTRRHFITATLSASILPRLAWAQSTSIIDGRTFQGTRAATGTAGQGGEGIRAKSAMTLRNCRFRSEEHTSELQSLMRISYAVFCLKKKTNYTNQDNQTINTDNH